ncbi:hypothetical protein F2Q69_00013612 [Brassica cretica]|uniref:Retrotransposon gag domain-containing protein n=1 Tax=Brassica cretica TaxID=69181 RepID=A0A8S9QKL0_BRACR|nr:hypothetical protein F2Q69_00013612 [Brassica cretica]
MGGLYKELTMYPCKTMEDVLSRAWAQVKWEEDVASRAKAQPKQDQRSARSDRGDQDERSSQRGSKDSGSRNRGRFQYRLQEKEGGMSMGQQVKWPPKMKAPDSFRNPRLWCDFHRDHGHKTEDCIALRIEVNELFQKGHLREFLSEKAKAHLSKETAGKSKGAAPASPPRQDRVIHVISGGSERGPRTPRTQGSEVNDTCNLGSFRRRPTLNHSKNPRDPQRTYVDRYAWSPPKPFKVITDIHRTQGTTGENSNLSSEVQSLKEKLDEHSKQLELSAEKLSQLQSEDTALRDQNQTLNVAGNKKRRFNTRVQPIENLNTSSTGEGTTDTPPASGVAGATREGTENPLINDLEESDSEHYPRKEEPEKAATESSITAYLEQMFSRRFDAMQSMVECLQGVAPPIRRSNPDSYADTPFAEEIASVEMPRKFSFPSIKMYDDHIAQYKQRMLADALPKESREATMCKGPERQIRGAIRKQ